MNINIKRIDMTLWQPTLLEEWNCDLDSALAVLTEKTGIDFSPYRNEIATNQSSSFERREMVCSGDGGYLAHVMYSIEIRAADSAEYARYEPIPSTVETECGRGVGMGYVAMP
jgi:hypothetical protein